MSGRESQPTDAGSYDSKVARLIEAYGLGEAYGDRLESRWLGESGDRASVRELTDAFNQRLLQAAVDAADVTYLDGELENLYRLLVADDVSSGARVEARDRLSRDGVDVDSLESDFVSHQTMWNYLRRYREAARPVETDGKLDRERQNIQRLLSRTDSVVTEKLDRLGAADELTLGEFIVFVDVDVLCQDCGTQYSVGELLDGGGCDCAVR